MKHTIRRLLSEKDGTTTLEFAILGSVFLVLTMFIIGAGLMLWTKGAMQIAAAQTARCTAIAGPACTCTVIGTLACTTSQIQDKQYTYASSLLTTWGVTGLAPSPTVNVYPNDLCGGVAGQGQFSKVTISSAGGFTWAIAPLSGIVLTANACYTSGG